MKKPNEVATIENQSQALQTESFAEISWPDVQRQFAPAATEKEFAMFMGIAKAYGLNPFKREIHFSKYGNNASVIVGYEFYIKRAERSGLLDGWSVVLGKDDLGQFATITIHRKDRSKPFEWTVYRSECDSGQATWKKMPLFMLRKVAIGQGFRLCFPEELGGIAYLAEEITNMSEDEATNGGVTIAVGNHHDNQDEPPFEGEYTEQPSEKITDEQRSTIVDMIAHVEMTEADVVAMCAWALPGATSVEEIPANKYDAVLGILKNREEGLEDESRKKSEGAS